MEFSEKANKDENREGDNDEIDDVLEEKAIGDAGGCVGAEKVWNGDF